MGRASSAIFSQAENPRETPAVGVLGNGCALYINASKAGVLETRIIRGARDSNILH